MLPGQARARRPPRYVGRRAALELGAVCTTPPPIAAAAVELSGVLLVELELSDRRADVGRGAALELGGVLLVELELGDRRADVGRGAALELAAVRRTKSRSSGP